MGRPCILCVSRPRVHPRNQTALGLRDKQNLAWVDFVWVAWYWLICFKHFFVARVVAECLRRDCPKRIALFDSVKHRLACTGHTVLNRRNTADVANRQNNFFFHFLANGFARHFDCVTINGDLHASRVETQLFNFVLQRSTA